MIKVNHVWVNSREDGFPYPQVEQSTECLFKAMGRMEYMAKPKHFELLSCSLVRFETVPSDESHHLVRNIYPPDKAIDEVYAWKVYGKIAGRIVNVVSEYIVHTYENNRSGSGEWFINGKDAHLREDLGGLTKEDIWQDNNKWKDYREWTRVPYQDVVNV